MQMIRFLNTEEDRERQILHESQYKVKSDLRKWVNILAMVSIAFIRERSKWLACMCRRGKPLVSSIVWQRDGKAFVYNSISAYSSTVSVSVTDQFFFYLQKFWRASASWTRRMLCDSE